MADDQFEAELRQAVQDPPAVAVPGRPRRGPRGRAGWLADKAEAWARPTKGER